MPCEQRKNRLYIYIKGSIYVQLCHEEELELKLYENREDFIELLNREFMFSACEDDFCIEITQEEMSMVVELYLTGKSQQLGIMLEESGINAEHLQRALAVFVENKGSKDFVG